MWRLLICQRAGTCRLPRSVVQPSNWRFLGRGSMVFKLCCQIGDAIIKREHNRRCHLKQRSWLFRTVSQLSMAAQDIEEPRKIQHKPSTADPLLQQRSSLARVLITIKKRLCWFCIASQHHHRILIWTLEVAEDHKYCVLGRFSCFA